MRIQEILESTGGITDSWFKDGFETFKKPAKEKYQIASADGTVKTLEGPVSYKKGYYIMTGPKGEQYPMPPEKFKELKDDHGNGVASSKKIIKTAKLADHDGSVNTSWGATLEYRKGQDYIVRHGANDYGVVKADIFQKTYDTSKANESFEDINRRDFLKGIGATAVAGALGGKVNLAQAALDYKSLQPGDKYFYAVVIDTSTGQGGKYLFSIETFKDVKEAEQFITKHFTDRGHKNIQVTVERRIKSQSKESIEETIRKQGSKYVIYSKDGKKKLGTYTSRKAAEKRLGQIEYFKHKG